jgi:hypothetical protein
MTAPSHSLDSNVLTANTTQEIDLRGDEPESEKRRVIEPESLLLLSMTIGRYNARLFDEIPVKWKRLANRKALVSRDIEPWAGG